MGPFCAKLPLSDLEKILSRTANILHDQGHSEQWKGRRVVVVDGTGLSMPDYVHDETEAEIYDTPPGTFTDWRKIPADTELLFYEGLHGAVIDEDA